MLDAFARYMNTTAEYYAKTTGMDSNGIPNDGWSTTAYKTVSICYYSGSQAESYVSERLRSTVSGVIICYPADKPLMTDLVKLSGRFFVVQGDPDDVMNLGEVCVVALGERI